MTVRKIGETVVNTPLRRGSLLVIAVLFFISVTAFAVPPVMYDIYIYDGDTVLTVSTSETDANAIIEKEGIKLNSAYGDRLDLSGFKEGEDGKIVIKRGVKVSITNYDGTSYTVYAADTVSDAVKAAGVTIPKGGATNYALSTALEAGMNIEIYDIYNIVLSSDGKLSKKSVSGKTVKDALKALKIKLDGGDFVEPALDTALKDNMKITIYRVTSSQRTEEETIAYETNYVNTDSLYKNTSKVITDGVNGTKKVVYTDYFINGELKKSDVESETIIKQPVSKVVQVGTKVNVHPTTLPTSSPISEMAAPASLNIGADGLPTNYSSAIKAKATAYCEPGGTTSTGKRAQTGYIAVDPNEIPYGTEMYIVSADGRYVYGYCIAADTGGYIYDVDWTVDLYMNSESQCVSWGRRDIIIYFL